MPGLGNHLSPLNVFHNVSGGHEADTEQAETPEGELSHSPPPPTQQIARCVVVILVPKSLCLLTPQTLAAGQL